MELTSLSPSQRNWKRCNGRGIWGCRRKTNKIVAIKAISSKKVTDPGAFVSFRIELKILHKLKHINIIKILGKEKTANNIYLVLDYANGGNLFEYLSYHKKTYNAPSSEQIVQFLTRQITNGLKYLHQLNIIHRDIKLENILLHFPEKKEQVNYSKEEAIIKIADLGYGKELSDSWVAQTFCGKPMCMAPEMVGVLDAYNNNSKV